MSNRLLWSGKSTILKLQLKLLKLHVGDGAEGQRTGSMALFSWKMLKLPSFARMWQSGCSKRVNLDIQGQNGLFVILYALILTNFNNFNCF